MKTQTTQKTKVKNPIPKASKGSSRFMLLVIGTILFFLITMMVNVAKGQDTYPYIPDRPGMAANPYLVGLHQMDYAASFGYNYLVFDHQINYTYQTNMVRYGLFKHLEMRVGLDFIYYNPTTYYVVGLKDINLGVKVPIVQGVKYLPDIAVLGTCYLPQIGQPEMRFDQYAGNVTLLLQKGFGRFQLLGNGGIFWDTHTQDGITCININSTDHQMQWSYAVALYYFIIKDKLAIFGETYGYASQQNAPLAACDGGISLSITPSLEWDLSAGIDYNKGIDNSFVNTGIGWRIPNKNK